MNAFAKVDPEGLACCIPIPLPSETGESSWGEGALSSGGNRKAPKCLAFPKGKQKLQVPAALEEMVAGSRSLHARRHRDCSAFEGCYSITLLHNDITCVFPLLIHFCWL